jgi:ComF family protein
MLSRFRHLPQHVLSRLAGVLPNACALCGSTGANALCDGCHAQFFSETPPRCRQCAALLPHAADQPMRCGDCLDHSPAFDATVVAANYAAPVDQLVLALKFGSRLALAPLFAGMLRNAMLGARHDDLPTVLTAVPLGAQRLAERGFNQALEIAKPLSKTLGISVDAGLLSRTRDTRAQAMLHPDERRQNMRRAFIVPADAIERVRGRHIGVVDDVITTGATLDEIAATLKRFGATRVTNIVFARTVYQ